MRKAPKIKEAVKIRYKALANGGKSIFLDYYRNGARVKEYLKMYLLPERTPFDKETNQVTLRSATAIKAERTRQLVNGLAGIRDTACKATLLALTAQRAEESRHRAIANGRTDQRAAKLIESSAKHLAGYIAARYGCNDMQLGKVDREFCEGFARYLCECDAYRGSGPLAPNTRRIYYRAFAATMNYAERKELIGQSPLARLRRADLFGKPEEAEREYLTAEELQAMADTPARRADVRAAFLFSCFCGLRWSDIQALRWGDIQTAGGWRIERRQAKTREMLYLPLGETARAYLPERDGQDDTAPVFRLPALSCAEKVIARWTKDAGVSKHITFHCARHTFATLLLTRGADIYTTSKLLGHTNVKTTQIYAKIVDAKKAEAVDLLDGVVQKGGER